MSSEINIKSAVLHILDNNVTMPVLSDKEMELDNDTLSFLENIINKAFNDDNLKNAKFSYESAIEELFLQLTKKDLTFIDFTKKIAGDLFSLMLSNPGISGADLICSDFKFNDNNYIGIFKLNYKNNYIHFVKYEDDTNINVLVKQKTVLPNENQKVEECILINTNNLAIQLIEKEYEIDGEKIPYLSQVFLKCEDELSTAQKVKIIGKTAQKLSKKYYDKEFDNIARLNQAIAENIEEINAIDIEEIARETFADNRQIQAEYLNEIQNAGIKEKEIHLPEKIAERKFKTHKIKTDTGIEINFPSIFYNKKDKIEFLNNPDGSISIIIRNVNKITNK